MNYMFEIVGVSPIVSFFDYQVKSESSPDISGPAYLASFRCTLDAFIESAEPILPRRGWNMDEAIDAVIEFWVNNGETVRHWKNRLSDAGSENLLVARLGDVDALRFELESLL